MMNLIGYSRFIRIGSASEISAVLYSPSSRKFPIFAFSMTTPVSGAVTS